jgi:manganese/zinc/iron transport system permease protein
MSAFWIILTGSIIAVTGGLLGSFLILRKMAMVGDAISHAVLPGIVLAFLLSGSRDSLPMLIGAASLGVFVTIFIEFLHKKARLQTDASIGISFTSLFAIGVILISYYAGQVDLDQDCVLYGEISYVPLDMIYTESGLTLGPRAVWISGANLLLTIGFIIVGFRGLTITTFNEEFAKSLGISTLFWHFTLMSFVSLTTVVSFESVGAILVVAFLIVPAASAYLLTDKLLNMLLLSTLFGVLSAIGGYYLAAMIDGSVAGAMASVSGLLFFIIFGFSILRRKTQTQMIEQS